MAFVRLCNNSSTIFLLPRILSTLSTVKITSQMARLTAFLDVRVVPQHVEGEPDVLSVDNPYRVNKFDMPLCQFNGTSAVNTTFNAAFCLKRESTLPGNSLGYGPWSRRGIS